MDTQPKKPEKTIIFLYQDQYQRLFDAWKSSGNRRSTKMMIAEAVLGKEFVAASLRFDSKGFQLAVLEGDAEDPVSMPYLDLPEHD